MKKIRAVVLCFACLVCAVVIALREAAVYEDRRQLRMIQDDRNKLTEINQVLAKMLKHKQAGKDLSAFFEQNNYATVAIYGMKDIGIALYNELRASGIKVSYGIDKDDNIRIEGISVFSPDKSLENVDVIVVTAIHYFDEIAGVLNKKVNCPIISVEDIFDV